MALYAASYVPGQCIRVSGSPAVGWASAHRGGFRVARTGTPLGSTLFCACFLRLCQAVEGFTETLDHETLQPNGEPEPLKRPVTWLKWHLVTAQAQTIRRGDTAKAAAAAVGPEPQDPETCIARMDINTGVCASRGVGGADPCTWLYAGSTARC